MPALARSSQAAFRIHLRHQVPWRGGISAALRHQSSGGKEYIQTRRLPNDLGELHLAAAQSLSSEIPGNGGLRLWHYESGEKAKTEALGLGRGMSVKHETFNTGFAGAKLVCAASKPPSSWSPEEKKTLLDEVAAMLKGLNGSMYTGCDMNTTTTDMDYLSDKCLDEAGSDYVLAAIGNKACCPNTATAYGVFGAVEAVLGCDVAGKKLLVHGCGGVGSVVAKLLVEHGAESVSTVDSATGRANLDGCNNVSGEADWWKGSYDAIVPCSSSGLLTEAQDLSATGAVVGATNLPFATPAAQAAAEKNLTFVPEGVSSAGAVIVDSVEHYSRDHFVKAEPKHLYEFTRETVRAKTLEVITLAQQNSTHPSKVVADVAEPRDSEPIGRRFAFWADQKAAEDKALASAQAAVEARAAAIGHFARVASTVKARSAAGMSRGFGSVAKKRS